MRPVCTSTRCYTSVIISTHKALLFSTCSVGCWMKLFHSNLPEVTQQQQEGDKHAMCLLNDPRRICYRFHECLLNILRCCYTVCACVRTVDEYVRFSICLCLTCLCISSKTKRHDGSLWSSTSSWTSTDTKMHAFTQTQTSKDKHRKNSLNKHHRSTVSLFSRKIPAIREQG